MHVPLSLCVVSCALMFAPQAAAQAAAQTPDFNVTRLASIDEHNAYSNIWGYVAPDGREYALLGSRLGTVIYNATDPLHVEEVGFFPSTQCLWRELKAYGHYVYVVNDCSGGVEVIDMADPQQPVLVNTFGVSLLKHAHTVSVDLATGKLYACGTDAGLAIYDLAVNPVNPPLVTTWQGQGVPSAGGLTGYSHDLSIRDGLVHLGMIQDGYYAILDVSHLPQISVVSVTESP
ncbi:MAG TPA: hypothetical protein VK824_10585, partial [Planctomycetota bacterium]|nr:hypothetical protein [Planctomycetota bacterium]